MSSVPPFGVNVLTILALIRFSVNMKKRGNRAIQFSIFNPFLANQDRCLKKGAKPYNFLKLNDPKEGRVICWIGKAFLTTGN